MLVEVLPAPLLMQLPANVPRKAGGHDSSLRAPASTLELPVSAWPRRGHLRNEPAEGKVLFLPFSPVTLILK